MPLRPLCLIFQRVLRLILLLARGSSPVARGLGAPPCESETTLELGGSGCLAALIRRLP